MKIAFLYSSKAGMTSLWNRSRVEEMREDEEEPPPDWFAECDTDETIQAVYNALAERHEVIPVESDDRAYNRLKRERPDLVFNISERLTGPSRESHIPTLCEILEIPYTGSDPLTLGICLDKSRAKEILSYHGIPNPEFRIMDGGLFPIDDRFPFPAIVKPLYEGSSKGIRDRSVVKSAPELVERVGEVVSAYRQPAIVERFLKGREFTAGVLGNHPNLEILPVVEIDHSLLPAGANPIYSYEAKWVWDRPENPLAIFKCPAVLSPELKARMEDVITRACLVLRIRDWCRIDLRLDENDEPNILELNPLPGILPNPEDNSCLPKAARTAGYSYSDLIHRVVHEACLRYGLKHEYGKPSDRHRLQRLRPDFRDARRARV
jgi:D-alanine-D-alanine ligase